MCENSAAVLRKSVLKVPVGPVFRWRPPAWIERGGRFEKALTAFSQGKIL